MSDDVAESLRRIRKEQKQRERDAMTPLQRAEMSRGEDIVLLIFAVNALVFVGYVLFGEASEFALWGSVLCLGIVIVALVARFRRPLH